MTNKLNNSSFLKINNLAFRDKNFNLIINNFTLNIKKGEIHAFLSDDREQLERLKWLFIDNLNENKKTEEFIFDQGERYSKANLLLNKNYSGKHTSYTNLFYKFIKSDYARNKYNKNLKEFKSKINDLESKIEKKKNQLSKSNFSLKDAANDFALNEGKKYFKNSEINILNIKEELSLIDIKIERERNIYKRNLKYIKKKYFFNIYQLKNKKEEWKKTSYFFKDLNKSWYFLSKKEFLLVKKYSLDQRDFLIIKNEIKRFIRLLILESGEKNNILIANPIRMRLFLLIKNLEKIDLSEEKIEYIWNNVLNIINKNSDQIKENIKVKILEFQNYINNLLFQKSIINTKINRITYNYLSLYVRNKIKEIEYMIFDIKKIREDISLKNHNKFSINLYLADIKHYNYQVFILENLRNYFINLVDFFGEAYFFYDFSYLKKFHKIIDQKTEEIYKKYKNYYDWQIKSSIDRKKLQRFILKKELNLLISDSRKRKIVLRKILFDNKILINKTNQFFNNTKKEFIKNVIKDFKEQDIEFDEKAIEKKNQQVLILEKELEEVVNEYNKFHKTKFNKFEKNLFDERLNSFLKYLNISEQSLNKKYQKLDINEKILIQILNLLIIDSPLVIIDDYFLNDFNIKLSEIVRNLNIINQDYKFTILIFVNNLKFIQLFAKRITFFYNGQYLETVNIVKDWINELKNSQSKDLLFYISKDSLKSYNFFNSYKPVGERFRDINYNLGKNKKLKNNHLVYTSDKF